jgi:hypothetical protein
MAKNVLSLFVIIMITGTSLSAQNCVPDPQYTLPGIYPDTATNLPCAVAGVLYNATITVVLPADTVGEITPGNTVPVTIDSIKVEDTSGDGIAVSGLPPNVINACEPTSCAFPGDAAGCLLLIGTPNIGDTGLHIITVELVAYVTEPTLGLSLAQDLDPLDYYSILVVADASECPTVGVGEINKTDVGILGNVPNPFEGKTKIEFTLPSSGNVDFQVHSILGALVHSELITGKVGLNKVEFYSDGMDPGIYLYTLSTRSSVATGRMIVSE